MWQKKSYDSVNNESIHKEAANDLVIYLIHLETETEELRLDLSAGSHKPACSTSVYRNTLF